jgi:hypothetical protein
MKFYMQVRPWGFWTPVIRQIHRYYPTFERNPFFPRDITNVIVGVTWQTSLVLFPIALVTRQYPLLTGVGISIVVTSIILKFNWWNKLDELSKETLPADFDERVPLSPVPGIRALTHTDLAGVRGPVPS